MSDKQDIDQIVKDARIQIHNFILQRLSKNLIRYEEDEIERIIKAACEKARQPLEAKLAMLVPNEVIEIDEHGKISQLKGEP